LIIPIIMPPVAVSIMWFLMYEYTFGVFNFLLNQVGLPSVRWLSDASIALYSMMAVDVWQATPFAFLLLYAAVLSLPRDPYEAAAIDGAGRWHVFRTVTLPLLSPILLVSDRRRTYLRQDLRHDARRSWFILVYDDVDDLRRGIQQV
jgi:multiple sugar transport system permease protein